MLTSTIALTDQVYTPAAIRETTMAFLSICAASFTTENSEHILHLVAPDEHTKDEFLNYALALSAEELLA